MLLTNWFRMNNFRDALKFWVGVIYDAYGPCDEDMFARMVCDGLRAERLPCDENVKVAIRHMREAMMSIREGTWPAKDS